MLKGFGSLVPSMLLLAALLSSPAYAGFIGNTVSADYHWPNLGTILYPSGNAVVGAGIEFPNVGGFGVGISPSVDISDTNILITYPVGFSFAPPPKTFDGWVISDLLGVIPNIIGVSLRGTNIPGYDASQLSFESDHVYINQLNFASFAANAFISVDVQFDTGPTFQWPVGSPILPPGQGYACQNCLESQKYPFHTGIDMRSSLHSSTPYDTPINPAADGLVVGIFITSDPTNTWCNGTRDYFNSSSISSNNHGLGNAVILEHTLGESTIYTLYGHLDCIHWDIVKKHLRIDGTGPSISVADVLGKMGNSAYTKKRCDLGMDCNQDGKVDGFNPHLHFEVKAWGVLGNLSDHSGPYYGYTLGHPNWHGYINPNPLLDYLLREESPTVIRVTGNNLPIRSGPDPIIYAQLGTVSTGQKFVAFSEHNGWYQVYLPSADGPATGWIQGTVDTSSVWINIVDDVSDPDPLERFTGVNVRVYPTTTVSTILTKVWQDQQFVIEGAPQSGSGCSASWYKIHLPNDAGAQYGWVCGQYVK